MTTIQGLPTLQTFKSDEESSDLEPAELGATLRDLALRGHRLVLVAHGVGSGADDSGQDLADVYDWIVGLQ
jgi:hypothetical protein